VSPNGHWTVLDESKDVKDDYIHSCGQYIQGKDIHLTVRDGRFILSGSGETRPETVPFCPKCGSEPARGFITSDSTIVIN
jgi:hypothetical protein